ncbi:MAG: putative lipid II flippase FtsW [Treponema sp.]|jgi:cell division protein FtsW|nr:putative lipid II flippase FtsW [Treponema sp.]
MYHFEAEKAQDLRQSHIFFACVLLLTGVGLATLYSASFAYAQRFMRNSHQLIVRQSVIAAFGLVLFFIVSRINLEKIRKIIVPLLALAAFLCVMAIIPGIGVEKKGASRWLEIGYLSYQPSEMVKFVLPLYLAHILEKKEDNLHAFSTGILPPVLITGIFLALIYAQNNFSTAVLIMVNAMAIFLFAGLRYRYFAAVIMVFVPVSALLVFTKTHRVMRLLSYLKPEWDPMGAGFQVRASRLTIISGGFWGKGIGQGTRKIGSVPEIHSDFIFSAYVEETGFLGVVFFFVIITVFAVLGYKIALGANSVYKRLLAGGLTTMIVSQALLNVAVVAGALPATGIPLPFFSAGGSSLVTSLICAGLIANVARKKQILPVHENTAGENAPEENDDR